MVDFSGQNTNNPSQGISTRWAALVPSDGAAQPLGIRAVYCVTAGTFVAKGTDGVPGTFTMAVGQILYISPVIVNLTAITGTYNLLF